MAIQLSEQQKRKLIASAEIVDKGQMAVIEKILEFQVFLDTWQEEIKALKDEIQETLPKSIHDKLAELSMEVKAEMAGFSLFKDEVDKMMNDHELDKEKHAEMVSKMQSDITSVSKMMIAGIAEVKGMIPEMPEETDLTDIYNRLVEIEGKIPKIPEELTAYQVRDKLESIDNESEKLSIDAIQGLRKELDEMKKKSGGRSFFGGGFNYSSMNIHIIDDETPAGTKDGNNTVFTVANTPSPASSLKVYVNGQRQRATENYTFSGTTITFVEAPLPTDIILVDYRV